MGIQPLFRPTDELQPELEQIYRRHADAVYTLALRITGSRADAEDVVQDLFVALPRAMRRYREVGRFESWLKQVTARLALTRLRSNRRKREDSIDTITALHIGTEQNPLDAIALERAIQQLAQPLRTVFVLREIEGFSHAEIADLLGITSASSAKCLARLKEGNRMMIRHFSLDLLRARAANELKAEISGRIDAHVEDCARCRAQMNWIGQLRSTVAELPVYAADPGLWVGIRNRVNAGEAVFLPEASAAPPSRIRRVAVAALFVFSAGAAAAATVGRERIESWMESFGTSTESAVLAPVDSIHEAKTLTLLVAPDRGSIAIVIDAPSPATRLRIKMVDGSELEMHATGAAATSRIRSAAGQLIIVRPDSGEIVLGLPRSTRLITVRANDHELLRAQGGQLHLNVRADTAGPDILLPLSTPPARLIEP